MIRKKSPDPNDVEVGRRVRTFRLERGISQEKLAVKLGLTFQQVQKYEKGTNRIGAGRLQRIAEVLGIPIKDFFGAEMSSKHAPIEAFELLNTHSSLRLLRAYARISNPQVRQALVNLTEAMSEG